MRRSQRHRRTLGQSLVELALILPIFILVAVAIFDLGRAVYTQHTVGNAARGGARVAIVDQTPSLVRAGAQEHAVGLDATVLNVQFTDCPNTTLQPKKIGCEAQVTVTYPFAPVTPLVGALAGAMTLESTTAVAIERVYTQ